MSSTDHALSWSRLRWLVALVAIFLTQLLLIFLLSAREKAPVPSRQPALVQILTRQLDQAEFAKAFLAEDPTLFAMANSQSFSAAWLKNPQPDYDLADRIIEAPFWLSLNSEHLGKPTARFVETNAQKPQLVFENPKPKILAAPILGFPAPARSNSILRIEGDLAADETMSRMQLKSWAHPEILSNSVVEVVVDRNGLVISPRLLLRSGKPEADREALDIARNFSFVRDKETQIARGKLVFEWHTVGPAVTNGTNKTQLNTNISPP